MAAAHRHQKLLLAHCRTIIAPLLWVHKVLAKGLCKQSCRLGDGRAVKLTTARYFTPSGRSIQAEGIVPDITIERAEIRPYTTPDRVKEADLDGHLEAEE